MAKQQGHRGRKIGRNKLKCERYRLRKTRERNKVRKILKYTKRHPNDNQIKLRLAELQKML